LALLLTDDEVGRALSMAEAIVALRGAFAGGYDLLPRWRGRAPAGTVGVYNVMAASVPAMGYMGLKSYAWVKGGRLRFHVLLYSWATGALEAVLEADRLGQIRTGAASGLATDLLARPDARVMGCIGAGHQAFYQIAAVAEVRRLAEVRVASRRPERAQALAERVRSALGVPARAVASPEEAATGSDIVTTMTSASNPVLLGDWLAPGTHVNAAGSNVAHHRELDEAAVLRAARVVVDDRAEAQVECGDLIAVIQAGRFTWDRAEGLGDLVAGRVPGRAGADDITLFESQGIAAEDVAAAARAVANARRLGLGQELAIE
jgi:alanine dehydrogenase